MEPLRRYKYVSAGAWLQRRVHKGRLAHARDPIEEVLSATYFLFRFFTLPTLRTNLWLLG